MPFVVLAANTMLREARPAEGISLAIVAQLPPRERGREAGGVAKSVGSGRSEEDVGEGGIRVVGRGPARRVLDRECVVRPGDGECPACAAQVVTAPAAARDPCARAVCGGASAVATPSESRVSVRRIVGPRCERCSGCSPHGRAAIVRPTEIACITHTTRSRAESSCLRRKKSRCANNFAHHRRLEYEARSVARSQHVLPLRQHELALLRARTSTRT